jgi:uncharacterized protein
MTQCWIITEAGLKGTENQCIALAQAAGLTYETKSIKLKSPWKIFTPWLRHFSPKALTPDSADLTPPWPEIIIASGRKSIAAGLWVKKQSGGKAKLVIIQSPVVKDKNFDLIIVPQHDNYFGPNVMQITGALSLITPQSLEAAKIEWAPTLEALPAPRIAVLIGGTSRAHKITNTVADRIILQLKNLLEQGNSLMITVSRRTPDAIRDKLGAALQHPNAYFFDGSGPNPYQGFLAWADTILVTEDSVSMASEAISTGKPVYIVALEGGTKRFDRFHSHLVNQGYARRFSGVIGNYPYTPPNDLATAANLLKQ